MVRERQPCVLFVQECEVVTTINYAVQRVLRKCEVQNCCRFLGFMTYKLLEYKETFFRLSFPFEWEVYGVLYIQ